MLWVSKNLIENILSMAVITPTRVGFYHHSVKPLRMGREYLHPKVKIDNDESSWDLLESTKIWVFIQIQIKESIKLSTSKNFWG